MSISEQVKELRDCVRRYQIAEYVSDSEPFRLLNKAADTIESLSAKLQAANMERSEADCSGWIPCSERLPEVDINENVKAGMCTDNGERFLITDTDGYVYESTFWAATQEFEDEAIAWMSKPEPYHEP